jgi:hypothetical protein
MCGLTIAVMVFKKISKYSLVILALQNKPTIITESFSTMSQTDTDQESTRLENGIPNEAPSPDGNQVDKVDEKFSDDFPDGGLQAWSVAISASFVIFSTLGYTNSFGYVEDRHFRKLFSQ